MAEIQRAVLRQLCQTGGALLAVGHRAEQHGVQRFGQPGAAIQRHKGVGAAQAFVVDALGHHGLAGARLAGEQHRGIVYRHASGHRRRILVLFAAHRQVVKAVLGNVAAAEQFTAQLAVHLDDAPALLEGEQRTLHIVFVADGRHVHHHRLAADVHDQRVGFLAEQQRFLQHRLA